MPVVEITQLRSKGLAVDDPALLESLSLVRGKLQTNSRFFSCIGDSSLIFIFGVWPNLDAHLDFLASPVRHAVLAPQEEMLDFLWTVHLELKDTDQLMLDTPSMSIERFKVDPGDVATYDEAVKEHVRQLQMSNSLSVAHGWRCDSPTGSHEAIILISSSSKGFHPTFAAGERAYQKIQYDIALNLEDTGSGI